MADPIRVATFAAPFGREGPGLMLRDLGREDAQIDAAARIVAEARPDVLLLTDVDHDHDRLGLAALADRLGYAHAFALAPNAGVPTGLDLDGNGRLSEPRDAQGYGRFTGDSGMALLSRWPVLAEDVVDHSALLWRDLPGASLPDGMTEAVSAVQRLSSTGHWEVPVATPGGTLTLLAWSATPPVFDGPEDRNGLRNRDELRLWRQVIPGRAGFVLIGNANLDPADGDGLRDAMAQLLADPAVIDPRPASDGGRAAADADHAGDPGLDTADWDGPGNLRVSYVLPSADWRVMDAGVLWPAPDDPLAEVAAAAGPHRLVWVDIDR